MMSQRPRREIAKLRHCCCIVSPPPVPDSIHPFKTANCTKMLKKIPRVADELCVDSLPVMGVPMELLFQQQLQALF